MGIPHEDKLTTNKDFNSPKKQRVLKLALDFERNAKIQNRDYFTLELTAKEILKIVESKHELDLQLIRHSRLIPAFFELLQKVPSLHKNEFSQVLKSLETGNFKSIQVSKSCMHSPPYLPTATTLFSPTDSIISYL